MPTGMSSGSRSPRRATREPRHQPGRAQHLALTLCINDRVPPDRELLVTTAQYELGPQARAADPDVQALYEQLTEAAQACAVELLGAG